MIPLKVEGIERFRLSFGDAIEHVLVALWDSIIVVLQSRWHWERLQYLYVSYHSESERQQVEDAAHYDIHGIS